MSLIKIQAVITGYFSETFKVSTIQPDQLDQRRKEGRQNKNH